MKSQFGWYSFLLLAVLFHSRPLPALTLREFVSLLDYTPLSSSSYRANQYSVTLNNSAFLSSIDVNFYNGNNCVSSAQTVTLTERVELHPGTYTSTNASNYALCSAYPSTACVGAGTGNTDHIQFVLHLDGDDEMGTCSANNYMENGSSAVCSSSGDCGFFTAINDSITPSNWFRSKQLGVASHSVAGNGVATDPSGNVIATGWVDGGLDSNSLIGVQDAFVTKYNGSGTKLWTKQLGDTGKTTGAYGVTADASNNIFIAGFTTAALDGGTANASDDFFLTKYNAAGTLQWTKQMGVSGKQTTAYGAATDSDNHIVIVGLTQGGIGGNSMIGTSDMFVAQYDESGTNLWTKQVGATGVQAVGAAICTDSAKNVIAVGGAYGGIDSNPLIGIYDTIVTKFDESGTKLWTKQFGVSGHNTQAGGVAADSSGNIFITGVTNGGLGGNTVTGTEDLFTVKMDSNGNILWTRQLGVSGVATYGNGASLDAAGNVYAAGTTAGWLDGNTSIGTQDTFVTKYNSSGTKIWTKQLGVVGQTTSAQGISTDPWGSVFTSGQTSGGYDGNTLTGTNDLFISKIEPSGLTAGGCTSDANCPLGGTFCANDEMRLGVCISGSDNTSSACMDDTVCSVNHFCGSSGDGTGSCTSGTLPIANGNGCTATNNCAPTNFCASDGDTNGTCQSGNDTTSGPCTATSNCTVNYFCQGDGVGGGICVSGNDNTDGSCTLDTDCSINYFCGSVGNGTGYCSSGNHNTNQPCTGDNNCSITYFCKNDGAGGGVCASGNDNLTGLCSSDSDCSVNVPCTSGFCNGSPLHGNAAIAGHSVSANRRQITFPITDALSFSRGHRP